MLRVHNVPAIYFSPKRLNPPSQCCVNLCKACKMQVFSHILAVTIILSMHYKQTLEKWTLKQWCDNSMPHDCLKSFLNAAMYKRHLHTVILRWQTALSSFISRTHLRCRWALTCTRTWTAPCSAFGPDDCWSSECSDASCWPWMDRQADRHIYISTTIRGDSMQ